MFDISAPKNHVIGFEGSDQARNNISNIAPPFSLPMLLEAAYADIVLEDAILVREMAEFHGLDNAIHNQGRSEPGPQAEK